MKRAAGEGFKDPASKVHIEAPAGAGGGGSGVTAPQVRKTKTKLNSGLAEDDGPAGAGGGGSGVTAPQAGKTKSNTKQIRHPNTEVTRELPTATKHKIFNVFFGNGAVLWRPYETKNGKTGVRFVIKKDPEYELDYERGRLISEKRTIEQHREKFIFEDSSGNELKRESYESTAMQISKVIICFSKSKKIKDEFKEDEFTDFLKNDKYCRSTEEEIAGFFKKDKELLSAELKRCGGNKEEENKVKGDFFKQIVMATKEVYSLLVRNQTLEKGEIKSPEKAKEIDKELGEKFEFLKAEGLLAYYREYRRDLKSTPGDIETAAASAVGGGGSGSMPTDPKTGTAYASGIGVGPSESYKDNPSREGNEGELEDDEWYLHIINGIYEADGKAAAASAGGGGGGSGSMPTDPKTGKAYASLASDAYLDWDLDGDEVFLAGRKHIFEGVMQKEREEKEQLKTPNPAPAATTGKKVSSGSLVRG